MRLFGSVSRSRLTKFQLSYKKRSKRQAYIANMLCSLKCVHVCVASFWARRTNVKHAAAAQTTAGHRRRCRRYVDVCMCIATQLGMSVVRLTKPAFLFCLVCARCAPATQLKRFDTLWVPSSWGLRRLHFFLLSLDFAKLDGELAARDTRFALRHTRIVSMGKNMKNRKKMIRMICAYHLYPIFLFAVFLPIRIADIIFFPLVCVRVSVRCVREICRINLMHACNGLAFVMCRMRERETVSGGERGTFCLNSHIVICLNRTQSLCVTTLSAINDGMRASGRGRGTLSESFSSVCSLLLFISFDRMNLMSMHCRFGTLKCLRKLFAKYFWNKYYIFLLQTSKLWIKRF